MPREIGGTDHDFLACRLHASEYNRRTGGVKKGIDLFLEKIENKSVPFFPYKKGKRFIFPFAVEQKINLSPFSQAMMYNWVGGKI
jgi:hypothetical protein